MYLNSGLYIAGAFYVNLVIPAENMETENTGPDVMLNFTKWIMAVMIKLYTNWTVSGRDKVPNFLFKIKRRYHSQVIFVVKFHMNIPRAL